MKTELIIKNTADKPKYLNVYKIQLNKIIHSKQGEKND